MEVLEGSCDQAMKVVGNKWKSGNVSWPRKALAPQLSVVLKHSSVARVEGVKLQTSSRQRFAAASRVLTQNERAVLSTISKRRG